MIEVSIKNISITDIGFVIFLKNNSKDRVLPIFIGPVEAQAISMILTGIKSKRPMTHDLTKNVIELMDYKINKVEITGMKNQTYYAQLYLTKKGLFQRSGKEIAVDSRPSDAIALAVRFNSPIFVEATIFKENSIELLDGTEGQSLETENNSGLLKGKNIGGMGVSKKVNDQLGVYHKMLEEAIKEERFEDASKIRDKIDLMIQKNNN